jgi:hypothetical protein
LKGPVDGKLAVLLGMNDFPVDLKRKDFAKGDLGEFNIE